MPERGLAAEGGVAFIVRAERAMRVDPAATYVSSLASYRLRVLIPALELARSLPVWLLPHEELLRQPTLAQFGKPDALVLGKAATGHLGRQRPMYERLLKLLEKGFRRPVLADFSDNLIAAGEEMNEPFLGEYQRRVSDTCTLVASCEALAEILRPGARRGIRVIEDPFESPRAGAPRAPAAKPLRLLWFGFLGNVNCSFVEASLSGILRELRDLDLEITLVAGADARALGHAVQAASNAAHPRLHFRFTPWSIESVESALERCDLVLLPQDTKGEWGRVKSHNRLVSAIRAGRFALASPIPAYRELSAFAWVEEDLAAGVRWALEHPREVLERIEAGQAEVERRFAPGAVAGKWAQVLGVTSAGAPSTH